MYGHDVMMGKGGVHGVKDGIKFMYHIETFFLGMETEQSSMFHSKPTYMNILLNSWPFCDTGCQGMPRGAVMWRMFERL